MEKPREEQQRAAPAQVNTDHRSVQAELNVTPVVTHFLSESLSSPQKGIMFEIRLDAEQEEEERTDEDEDKVGGPPCLLSEPAPQQDVDPLNQTLSFQEGEELKLRDWSEGRRGWSQRAPQTLLDALANMDVKSVSEPGQWLA